MCSIGAHVAETLSAVATTSLRRTLWVADRTLRPGQ
jgi:hypothetical protein